MLRLFEFAAILLVYVIGGVELRPRIGVTWPLPVTSIVYNSYGCLPKKINFICESCDDAVHTAIEQVNGELATVSGQEHCKGGKVLESVTLLATKEARVYTDPYAESYRMDFTEFEKAYIISDSTVGIRRGLIFLLNFMTLHNVKPPSLMEFGQNIPGDDPGTMYFTIPHCYIGDAPRFQHRGLMIDTGNHFISLEVLRRIVRTMSRVDLNVLHWHISDSGSMPLVTPQTSQAIHGAEDCRKSICSAAFSNAETYSLEEVKEFVEYAALRGVAVVLEADMPGRAMAWSRSAGAGAQLCQDVDSQVYSACDRAFCGETYLTNANLPGVALEALWGEFKDLPVSIPIHMGGHLSDQRCGGEVAQERNYQAFNSFVSYHFYDRRSFLHDHGYIDSYYVGRNTVVQLTKLHRMDWYIRNTEDRKFIWQLPDLDCGLDNTIAPGLGKNCDFVDWWTYYKTINDPDTNNTALLGFEVPIWTHNVDQDTIESLIWPRAAVLPLQIQMPTITNDITSALNIQNNLTRLMDSIQYTEQIPITPIYNRWCINNVTHHCQSYMKNNYNSPTSRFHSS